MTKLSSLYGRTVTLIAIVFLASFAVLALSFTSISALTNRDQVRELEKTILMANSSVRDFIITRDPVFAKRTELMLTQANKLLKDGIKSDDYVHLQTELHQYLYAIGSLIEVYQDRGFYEDSGIEGRMRSKMAKLEEKLTTESEQVLLALLLQIRRNEKNYLLRGRGEYQDAVHGDINKFMSAIHASNLSETDMAVISAGMMAYQTDFDGLVVLIQEVQWIRSELNNVREYLAESLSEILIGEERRAKTYLWVALGLIFVSFLFGILYSTYIAKSVVKPLDRIRAAAKKLAAGDLTEDFEIEPGSEVGELAQAFNEVSAQVRMRIQAEEKLRLSKEELEESSSKIEEARSELEHKATDLALLVDELQKAKGEAENATKSKAAFLASMSHEIRTPLSGIIGMTSLLASDDLSPDQKDIVEVVRTSGESLLGIVNDILDFSKIEAGGVVLEEAPMTVSENLEEALDLISRQAADKGLDVSYSVDEDVPVNLLGDATRLRQIIVNLLANAVKFTASGEVHARASILSASKESVELQFSISDTGIGIPSDKISTLFEAFKQAEVSTSRKYGGTGLGLSIARHLSELMSGRMWAESQVGVGSTFYFTADLLRDKACVIEPSRSDFAFGKNVILLNRTLRFGRALGQMIEAGGGTVHHVASEAEVRILLRGSIDHDLVLINDGPDGVSGLAGVAIAKALKDKTPECPVVLLRNLGDRVNDPVVTECLSKPIKISSLEKLFASLKVSGRASRRASERPRAEDRAPSAIEKKILLVEDNIINQKVALRMLQKLGYEADVAGDGAIAIDAVVDGRYDVVFMDIQMPKIDGLEATRRIRAHDGILRQPFIVALTANATTHDRAACLEAGMDEYLTKPFDMSALESVLAGLAGTTRMHPSVRRERSTGLFDS